MSVWMPIDCSSGGDGGEACGVFEGVYWNVRCALIKVPIGFTFLSSNPRKKNPRLLSLLSKCFSFVLVLILNQATNAAVSSLYLP